MGFPTVCYEYHWLKKKLSAEAAVLKAQRAAQAEPGGGRAGHEQASKLQAAGGRRHSAGRAGAGGVPRRWGRGRG